MKDWKLNLLSEAREDLRSITEDGSPYAVRVRRKILHEISLLFTMPFMGSPLRARHPVETDLRYLVVEKYLIFYRVTGETVEVTRIINGRTDFFSTLVL